MNLAAGPCFPVYLSNCCLSAPNVELAAQDS